MTPEQIAALTKALRESGATPAEVAEAIAKACGGGARRPKVRSPEYLARAAAKARERRAAERVGPSSAPDTRADATPIVGPSSAPVGPLSAPLALASRASDLLSDLPQISQISALPLSSEIDKTRAPLTREASAPVGPLEALPETTSPKALVLLETTPTQPSPEDQVWAAYLAARKARVGNAAPPARTPERTTKIRARIAESGLEMVLAAARNVWSDPWAIAQPSARCAPEAVFRNAERVERYGSALPTQEEPSRAIGGREVAKPWELPEYHPDWRPRHMFFTEEDRAQEWRKRPPKPIEFPPMPTKRPPFDPLVDKAMRDMGIDVEQVHRDQNAYWDKREAEEAAAAAKASEDAPMNDRDDDQQETGS